MLDWMKDGGANYDKLKLVYYNEKNRAVHAKSDIHTGEQVLYVPLSLLVTLEMAYKSPIGKKMYENGLTQSLISPKHTFLCAYMLQEMKKEETYWQTYIDLLPKSVNEFPVFFTDEEKTWLEGSRFLD